MIQANRGGGPFTRHLIRVENTKNEKERERGWGGILGKRQGLKPGGFKHHPANVMEAWLRRTTLPPKKKKRLNHSVSSPTNHNNTGFDSTLRKQWTACSLTGTPAPCAKEGTFCFVYPLKRPKIVQKHFFNYLIKGAKIDFFFFFNIFLKQWLGLRNNVERHRRFSLVVVPLF